MYPKGLCQNYMNDMNTSHKDRGLYYSEPCTDCNEDSQCVGGIRQLWRTWQDQKEYIIIHYTVGIIFVLEPVTITFATFIPFKHMMRGEISSEESGRRLPTSVYMNTQVEFTFTC